MKIRFVNHSSFIVEHDGKKIICDPWLEGKVFLNGWKLLSPTLFKYEEFADIDYIWFSHEHPDHFFPPNLKKIAPEHKKNITVLFQETIDKRVRDYCVNAGFKAVVEMKPDQFIAITPDFRVMCEHFLEGDSWICFQSKGQTILNANDCGMLNKSDLKEVLHKIGGKVDVLMTQFSYAFWAGNPEDVAERKKIADDKLLLVKAQCDYLKPSITIPIASFVYFCHEENKYLNDEINTAQKTYDYIRNHTSSEPVVLYNDEVYEYPKPHDSLASIAKYKADLDRVLREPASFDSMVASVPEEQLQQEAGKLIKDLNDNNLFFVKSQIKEAHVYITDMKATYSLSLNGFKREQQPPHAADVALSSELLLWCFKYPFGLDTVQISGRFRKPKGGNYTNFYNFFRINHLKMRGTDPNSAGVIAGILARKVLTKIGLNKNR
jgi:UDP-MurNAc hydroxylase